jgi:hypothetical protein
MANPVSNETLDAATLGKIVNDKTPGGVMSQNIIDQILKGKGSPDTASLYEKMSAAAAQPVNPLNAIATAAGSGASSPQTMALVNNPVASGVNNALRFARGFAKNVNAGMQRPTYKDMIEAKQLDLEQAKIDAAANKDKSTNPDMIRLEGEIGNWVKQNPDVLNFSKIQDAYGTISANRNVEKPNRITDEGIIKNIAYMINPNLPRLTADAADNVKTLNAIDPFLAGIYSKITTGTLDAPLRQQLLDYGDNVYKQKLDSIDKPLAYYKSMMVKGGMSTTGNEVYKLLNIESPTVTRARAALKSAKGEDGKPLTDDDKMLLNQIIQEENK